jgi:hypothetical protein
MTSKTKAILSLSSVFLLGGLCGALALGLFVRGQVREAQQLQNEEGFETYFADKLELSETQLDSLRDELDRAYADLEEFRVVAAQEYRDLLDSFSTRIYPSLSPEQRRLLAVHKQRLGDRLPRPNGRRPRIGIRTPSPMYDRNGSASDQKLADRRAEIPSVDSLPKGSPPSDTSPDADTHPPGELADATDTASPEDTDQFDPGAGFSDPAVSLINESVTLSDEQKQEVQLIFDLARKKIRSQLWDLRGRPHMQRNAVSKTLLRMHRMIFTRLDIEQRKQFNVIRDDMYDRINEHLEQMIKRLPSN